MAITRTAMVDDDGTGTTGTIINAAWKTELYNQIDAADVATGAAAPSKLIDISASTGTVNNFAPGLAGDTTLTWYAAAGTTTLTITGVAGGTTGAILRIKNVGIGVIFLPNLSGSSVAANQFTNMAGSAPTPVAGGGVAMYIQSGGGWLLVSHDQGLWITPAFLAADYVGSGGAWTVAAGNILMCRYQLRGRTLYWSFYVNGSTIAAGAQATRKLFGFTTDGTGYFPSAASFVDTAASGLTYAQHNAAVITVYKTIAGGGFAAGALRVSASGFCEVT